MSSGNDSLEISDLEVKASIEIYERTVSAIATGSRGVAKLYGNNLLAPYELRMDLEGGAEIATYEVITNEERRAIFEIIDLINSGIFGSEGNELIEDLESDAWNLVRGKAKNYLNVRNGGRDYFNKST